MISQNAIMSLERYKVRKVGMAWMETFGTRLDPDLTDAFKAAVGQRALHTQRAAARLIAALMNTRLNRGEPRDAFVTDGVVDGRLRINKLLRSVGHATLPDDASRQRVPRRGD